MQARWVGAKNVKYYIKFTSSIYLYFRLFSCNVRKNFFFSFGSFSCICVVYACVCVCELFRNGRLFCVANVDNAQPTMCMCFCAVSETNAARENSQMTARNNFIFRRQRWIFSFVRSLRNAEPKYCINSFWNRMQHVLPWATHHTGTDIVRQSWPKSPSWKRISFARIQGIDWIVQHQIDTCSMRSLLQWLADHMMAEVDQ